MYESLPLFSVLIYGAWHEEGTWYLKGLPSGYSHEGKEPTLEEAVMSHELLI